MNSEANDLDERIRLSDHDLGSTHRRDEYRSTWLLLMEDSFHVVFPCFLEWIIVRAGVDWKQWPEPWAGAR
jgi:hypothetical protein